jgi:hypothetical protein
VAVVCWVPFAVFGVSVTVGSDDPFGPLGGASPEIDSVSPSNSCSVVSLPGDASPVNVTVTFVSVFPPIVTSRDPLAVDPVSDSCGPLAARPVTVSCGSA